MAGSALLLTLGLAGCAAPLAESQPLGDGSYRIRCKAGLAACLRRAEELCPGVSYDVLAARDRRTYTGVEPAVVEHRSSEAIIACGSRGAPLFDEPDLRERVNRSQQAGAKHAAGTAAARPALACTPGVSQACVGVGGCTGGQACLADGSGFGACQCAPVSAPAVNPAEPQAPETQPTPPPESRAGAPAPTSAPSHGATSPTPMPTNPR